MSTPVDTPFVPRNQNTWVAEDIDLKGAMHIVPDVAARDAIPAARRKGGMFAVVQSDTQPNTIYQLQGDLVTWMVFSGGGGGLPSLVGNGLKFLRVNQAENAVFWSPITQDDILPGFKINSFVPGFSLIVRVNQAINNPPFTASYDQTPVNPGTNLNDGTGAVELLSPYTSFQYGTSPLPDRSGGNAYRIASVNGVQSWTLHARNAAGIDAPAAVISAVARELAFWDVATRPGSYNAAFIQSLANTRQEASFGGTYAFGAGGGTKYAYFCPPAAWGDPTSFTSGGFTVPMTKVATNVPVPNGFGANILTNVWESGAQPINPFSMLVG